MKTRTNDLSGAVRASSSAGITMNKMLLPAAAAILSLLSVAPGARGQNRPAGTVVAWGDNNAGQTNVPGAWQRRVVAISAGQVNTVILTTGGSVVEWESNLWGQNNVPAAAQSGVVAIPAGALHSLALKDIGSVVAWGGNSADVRTVPLAAKSGVVAIAAGGGHNLALKNDGSVIPWGGTSGGATNVPVAAQSGVVAIASGADHTVALKSDGSIVAWGRNDSGQATVPPGLSPAIAIEAGLYFTVALVHDPLPELTIQRNADQTVNLSWTGEGTLEQSGILDAPAWETSLDQSNPRTI